MHRPLTFKEYVYSKRKFYLYFLGLIIIVLIICIFNLNWIFNNEPDKTFINTIKILIFLYLFFCPFIFITSIIQIIIYSNISENSKIYNVSEYKEYLKSFEEEKKEKKRLEKYKKADLEYRKYKLNEYKELMGED